MFAEQAALDSGKLSLAWLLSGYPDTAPQMWQVLGNPSADLCAPQWLAANLAYLKDLDYAETRVAQIGGKGRPPNYGPAREHRESKARAPTSLSWFA